MKEVAKGKSPRLDIVGVKFYVHFWHVIGEKYYRMLQESLAMGNPPRVSIKVSSP
jgi:hypothetical protein